MIARFRIRFHFPFKVFFLGSMSIRHFRDGLTETKTLFKLTIDFSCLFPCLFVFHFSHCLRLRLSFDSMESDFGMRWMFAFRKLDPSVSLNRSNGIEMIVIHPTNVIDWDMIDRWNWMWNVDWFVAIWMLIASIFGPFLLDGIHEYVASFFALGYSELIWPADHFNVSNNNMTENFTRSRMRIEMCYFESTKQPRAHRRQKNVRIIDCRQRKAARP